MLRDTMTSTMPVAMMPIEALWTDRFHRLRGREEVPAGDDVEADPDDRQGGDHPEQAGVDLGGAEERARSPGAAPAPPARPWTRGGTGDAQTSCAFTMAPWKKSALRRRCGGAGRRWSGQLGPSGARVDRAGLDALAELFLCDPVGVEHDVQVVLGDRDRLQDDRVRVLPPGLSKAARCLPAAR